MSKEKFRVLFLVNNNFMKLGPINLNSNLISPLKLTGTFAAASITFGIIPVDANTWSTYGNTTYGPNGSYSTYGNTTYGPNGSYSTYGNTTYGPSGSYSTYGNTTYGPNGSISCYGNTCYGP